MYTMPSAEKAKLSKKCEDYAKSEFNHQKTIDDWDSTLAKTVENWKEGKSTTTRFELIEI